MGKCRYDEAELQGHIKAWRESGLSQVEYCRRTGISVHTLRRRLYKCGAGAKGEAKTRGRFLPVPLGGTALADVGQAGVQVKPLQSIGVYLPGGVRLEVPPAFSSESLGRLLEVLEEKKPCCR